MRADFVNEVARVLRISRRDLIEKDLILHQILAGLSQDNFHRLGYISGRRSRRKYFFAVHAFTCPRSMSA